MQDNLPRVTCLRLISHYQHNKTSYYIITTRYKAPGWTVEHSRMARNKAVTTKLFLQYLRTAAVDVPSRYRFKIALENIWLTTSSILPYQRMIRIMTHKAPRFLMRTRNCRFQPSFNKPNAHITLLWRIIQQLSYL